MESLGQKLKAAREKQGWDLVHIYKETSISVMYLNALEEEDFSVFPGEPYVFGFLKNYGEFLGLDTKELRRLYRSVLIRRQPIPVHELLKKPFPKAPKIIGILVVIAAILCAAFFFLSCELFTATRDSDFWEKLDAEIACANAP